MSVTREHGERLVKEFEGVLMDRGISVIGIHLTGSLATEDTGNDADCLLYVCPDDLPAVQEYLLGKFERCGAGSYGTVDQRSVWRSGDLNVILAHTMDEYICWYEALAFMLEHYLEFGKSLPKKLRVQLHQLSRGEHIG